MPIVNGRKVVYVTVTPPTGTKANLSGDSLTAGANASSQELSYPEIYSGYTGLFPRTMAQYGRTVQEACTTTPTNSFENVVFTPTPDQQQYNPVLNYDPDYKRLTFFFGINDCLQLINHPETNAETFKAVYKACLDVWLNVKNWPKNRVSVLNIAGYFGSNQTISDAVLAYNIKIKEMCKELGIRMIDTHKFVLDNGNQSLFNDDVHFNDLGHGKFGQYLSTVIP